MARIVVTQRLVDGGIDPLIENGHEVIELDKTEPISPGELVELAQGAAGILCLLTDSITSEVFSGLPDLQVVGTVAVGFDNVDLESARAHGVAVVNTPGVLDASTADLTMILMGAALRRTRDSEHALRTGGWRGFSMADHLGRDLTGATLGLVGYGRIGRAVAERARAFSMEILHHTRHSTGTPGWVASLHEMASKVDVLSIHVPLSQSTWHLIDATVLEALPPSAVIINTARGPVLDEKALARALRDGRLWGAGLDVYSHEPMVSPELLEAPHTVLLPHVGSATVATRRAMCQLAARGVCDVLEGRQPSNLV
jgi:glyoxylate reductase